MRSSALTVYILTYNRAKYLECTIESVLRQTYENYDLYVLDNCSTDETPKIIKKFNDSRLHYIRHEKNIGGIGNIQFAIRHCTTDFMIIFHDDDIMKADLLRKEIDILSENSKIAAVSCNANYVNEVGKKDQHTMFDCDEIKYYSSGELFRSYLTKNKWLCFPTIMYRNSFLKANNITFQEEAGPSGDVILCSDIGRYGGTICELPEALIYYRRHGDQESSKSNGIMHLMLFRYINSIPYYSNILKECSFAQPRMYKVLMRYIVRRVISKNSASDEAMELIKEFNSIIKHNKTDEWFTKMLIFINSIMPRTMFLLYETHHTLKLRRPRAK